MEWVSFDEIKKSVTLQMVIDRYGFTLRRVGPDTLRGKCPLPTHSSEKSTESFIANLSKGTGGAWVCQSNSCVAGRGGKKGGNVLDLVATMERCTIREAAVKLQSWFLPACGAVPARQELAAHTAAAQEPKAQLVSKESREGESGPNKPLSFALKGIDRSHPYLSGRGITPELADAFAVGFFPGKGSMAGRIVIPIHNGAGECVAYAGRAIDGNEPKYKFPAGFRKSLELFNLHRVPKDAGTVVVVEGFFDCMKVSQAGFPCVALMGCTMSETQRALLGEHFGQVILMLDGDGAGRDAAEEIAERLQQSVYLVKILELPDGIQPDGLSSEEIQNLLHPIM